MFVLENWLLLVWALLTAGPQMEASRKADPRMVCKLAAVEDGWVMIGTCERSIGYITNDARTSSSAVWRETYWQFSFSALGLQDPPTTLYINGSLQP